MSKNAAIYVRVSTEKQAGEGYSINAQKENLIAYAKEQNFNIISIYADEGISGKNIAGRPEIKRLINDIKKKLIDIVLIYKFDRLTRDISDTEEIICLVQNYGVLIHTLSSGVVDVSSPQGRFTTRIVGAVAQLEREQIIERIKIALKQKAKEGFSLCSSTPPYGYNRTKGTKTLSINKKESAVVKEIFKMFLGGKSCSSIAQSLNNKNIPTKKSKNKYTRWETKTIKLILVNPTYIGKIRYGINTSNYFETEGFHKKIIDIDTWNNVKKIINKQKRYVRTNKPKEEAYFCGFLYCNICGKKLTTSRTKKKTGKTYISYICSNKDRNRCNFSSVSHLKVEKLFTNYLMSIEDFTEIDKLVIYNDDDKTDYKKLILKARSKKKDIMNLFLNNILTKDELTNIFKKIEVQINEYKIKLCDKDRKINITNISPRIEIHWIKLLLSERYAFLTNFVDKIIVFSDKKEKLLKSVIFCYNNSH